MQSGRSNRSGTKCHRSWMREVYSMFLILALVLVLAWFGGFVVFHTAGFLIHLLLIFAVISIIMHFVRGSAARA